MLANHNCSFPRPSLSFLDHKDEESSSVAAVSSFSLYHSFFFRPLPLASSELAVDNDPSLSSDSVTSPASLPSSYSPLPSATLATVFRLQGPLTSGFSSCCSETSCGCSSGKAKQRSSFPFPLPKPHEIVEKAIASPSSASRRSGGPPSPFPDGAFFTSSIPSSSPSFHCVSSGRIGLLSYFFLISAPSPSDSLSDHFSSPLFTSTTTSIAPLQPAQERIHRDTPSGDFSPPLDPYFSFARKGSDHGRREEERSGDRCPLGIAPSHVVSFSYCSSTLLSELLLPLFQLHFRIEWQGQEWEGGGGERRNSVGWNLEKPSSFLSTRGEMKRENHSKRHKTECHTHSDSAARTEKRKVDGEVSSGRLIRNSLPLELLTSFSICIPAGWISPPDSTFTACLQSCASRKYCVICVDRSSAQMLPAAPVSSSPSVRALPHGKMHTPTRKFARLDNDVRFRLGVPISVEGLTEWVNGAEDPLLLPFSSVEERSQRAPGSFSSVPSDISENREILSFLFPAFHHHHYFEHLAAFERHCATREHRTKCSHSPFIPLQRCIASDRNALPFPPCPFAASTRGSPVRASIITVTRHPPGSHSRVLPHHHGAGERSDTTEGVALPGQEKEDDGILSDSPTGEINSNIVAYPFSSVRACLVLDLFSRLKEDLKEMGSYPTTVLPSPFPCKETMGKRRPAFPTLEKKASRGLCDMMDEGLARREDRDNRSYGHSGAVEQESEEEETVLKSLREAVLPHSLAARVAVLVVDAWMRGGPPFVSVKESNTVSPPASGCESEADSREELQIEGKEIVPPRISPFFLSSSLLITPPKEVIMEIRGTLDRKDGSWSMTSYSSIRLPAAVSESRAADTLPVCWSSWSSMTQWLSRLFPSIWRAVFYELLLWLQGLRVHPVITTFPSPFTRWEMASSEAMRSTSSLPSTSEIVEPEVPEEEMNLWNNSPLVPELIAILARSVVVFVREAEMRERFALLRCHAFRKRKTERTTITGKIEREEASVDEGKTQLPSRNAGVCSPSEVVKSTEEGKATRISCKEKTTEERRSRKTQDLRLRKRQREQIDEVNSDFYYLMAEFVMTSSLEASSREHSQKRMTSRKDLLHRVTNT